MPTTNPNSLPRYQQAIFALSGALAAYTIYSLYTSAHASGSNDLHRSNAVRRPNTRRRGSRSAHLNARLGSSVPQLGHVRVQGIEVPLGSSDLISPHEIRHLVSEQRPQATPEELDSAVGHVYDVFLDRLLVLVCRNRSPSTAEAEVIARWVDDQHHITYLNSAAIARALERHISALQSGALSPLLDENESVAATDLSWGSDAETEADAVDSDGQTLQRTLYHIAEDRARQEGVIHRGITCNGCDDKPIRGIRWHCANCADFDLCSNCEAVNSHSKTHVFLKIRVPAPYLGTTKQEPLYPGKPEVMPSSTPSVLKKRLVVETKMEAEEIDALWEQFTCLAGTEWLSDPNTVGWALDRRAFSHAFVPRYASFVAAPNLIYDRVFAYFDSDNNGLIGFEEWIKGLDGMHAADGHVKSRIVFNGYDVDGDGYISRKDILRIFRAYYAIEKEATRNFIAEITEEISVRNALDTIRSSQPLGSAFPPHGLANHHSDSHRIHGKHEDDFENTEPVLHDDLPDEADRGEMLRASNSRNVGLPGLHETEQNRIVTDRWARRQFFVDEEEGFDPPDGADEGGERGINHSNESRELTEDTGPTINDNETRPRWSRSSSRVRFQDDVDMETRSNASTSSRPIGERWGGYEIPEPEKDLGREVLYQVTQQGFNELLDPLFVDRENNAMDAYETRGERRQCAARLEQIIENFRTQEQLDYDRTTWRMGIFRYSKCMVELFRNALNKDRGGLQRLLRHEKGERISREEAKARLLKKYQSVQRAFLYAVGKPPETTVDELTLWNTWLCREQLQYETLSAVLDCASRSGLIDSTTSKLPYKDPTMPQFRPNSLTDADVSDDLSITSLNGTTRDKHTTYPSEAHTFLPSEVHVESTPTGPFFVCSSHGTQTMHITEQEATGEDNAPTQSSLPELVPINETGVVQQVPEVVQQAPEVVQQVPEVVQQFSPPIQEQEHAQHSAATRIYTRGPVMHFFHIEVDGGKEVLEAKSKAVLHSSDPFHPESDQTRPLYRHVRELAMDPSSKSHEILLASLEVVQQEIHERKGGGLITFEEFDEHMRGGKLGFLQSWLEWVNI